MKNLIFLSTLLLIFSACEPSLGPQVERVNNSNEAMVEGLAGSVLINAFSHDTTETTSDDFSTAWFDVENVIDVGSNITVSEILNSEYTGTKGRINVYFDKNELNKWNEVNHKNAKMVIEKVPYKTVKWKLVEIVPAYKVLKNY